MSNLNFIIYREEDGSINADVCPHESLEDTTQDIKFSEFYSDIIDHLSVDIGFRFAKGGLVLKVLLGAHNLQIGNYMDCERSFLEHVVSVVLRMGMKHKNSISDFAFFSEFNIDDYVRREGSEYDKNFITILKICEVSPGLFRYILGQAFEKGQELGRKGFIV